MNKNFTNIKTEIIRNYFTIILLMISISFPIIWFYNIDYVINTFFYNIDAPDNWALAITRGAQITIVIIMVSLASIMVKWYLIPRSKIIAQQGDAPEPATNAIPASPPSIPPAR